MSLDINLTNVQSVPIVVSSNTTATNDSIYTVVANATFTDPSPVEGKGFKVFVRNGIAVVGGVSYSVTGSLIVRTFHSGAWSTVYYYDYITSNNLFQSRANLSTDVNTDQASNSKYPSVKAVFDWATSLFIKKSDYTPAHSILAQQSGTGSPTAVTIGMNEILGRLSGGGSDIEGLSTSQVKSLLDLSGTNTGDQTFLNPRVQAVTSSATVTPTSTDDLVKITAQAVDLTLANPTGTFVEGQSLIIRIKDNGTARLISFGSNYRAVGVVLPTTTTISKTTYIGGIWNDADSKLDIVGICTEA